MRVQASAVIVSSDTLPNHCGALILEGKYENITFALPKSHPVGKVVRVEFTPEDQFAYIL